MADRRNDLTEYDRQLEEGQLEMIERLRVLWENTNNPVYVWRAVSYCFAIGMLRERGRTGVLPAPPWTEAFPFPGWCIGYISLVAGRIDTLSEGKDFRTHPRPFGKAEPTRDAHQRALDQEPTLSGQQANKLLPTALGFSDGGGNAFDRASSLRTKELDALSYATLKDQHGSSGAMQVLLSEAGIENERSMRKRLAEADRANGGGGRKRSKPAR